MNAATTRSTTTSRHSHAASTHERRHQGQAQHARPMPRSTTRVIWTMSSGTTVQYGEVR